LTFDFVKFHTKKTKAMTNFLGRRDCFAALFALLLPAVLSAQYTWQTLSASPQNGQKQDDIFMLSPQYGFCVNGSGRIFRTLNGGQTFQKVADQPGTYFRCIAFRDSLHGFAGNIGPNYFPNVTDANPLYRTDDGGNTWSVVSDISGPAPTGLCALQIVSPQVIVAGGRVGGPTHFLRSTDGGATWASQSLAAHISMVTDVYFSSPDTGYVFGGTNANVQFSKAKIIRTTDGGATWQAVYTGSRTFELCWKAHFPTAATGYVTLLSYAPNSPARFVGKTSDGGLTWQELPFTDNGNKAFGMGFLDENTGWVGCDNSIYETLDGGTTWVAKNVGQYVNKIRVLRTPQADYAFGMGVRAYKMTQLVVSATEPSATVGDWKVFPNPAFDSISFEYFLEKNAEVILEITDSQGRMVFSQHMGQQAQGQQKQTLPLQALPEGAYLARLNVGGIQAAKTIVKLNNRP
jgi:photosystem II stability/assembly factor-like uncharacterized protein